MPIQSWGQSVSARRGKRYAEIGLFTIVTWTITGLFFGDLTVLMRTIAGLTSKPMAAACGAAHASRKFS